MADPKPAEATTKQLPQTEILSGLLSRLSVSVERLEAKQDSGFKAIRSDFDLLAGQFQTIETEVRAMQSWRVRVEDRLKNNSLRAAAPSNMDLDLAAAQAQEIVKNKEQDEKIEQTHTLALETKALVVNLATAADARAKVLDSIAETLSKALKSKLAEKVAYAVGGFILAVIGYYMKRFGLS